MRKLVYFLLVTVVFSACGGSKKALDQGDYNTAVYKAVNALQKNASKEKNILALKEAYPKANARDLKQIDQLKLEGDPQAWDNIYNLYKALDARQEAVQTVAPLYLNGQEINFDYKNYQNNMAEAKLRAAQYYYSNAKKLMESDDQASNRKAFEQLEKVKSYFSTYEDVDQLMADAKYLGTSHVLISIKNESEYNYDRAYLAELLNFGIAEINTTWKNYYTNFSEEINYDYDIIVNITSSKFSEALRERSESLESKEIKDGWAYELDAKGNVKKDSLGNDIKKEKFKTIQCKVITETQKKSVVVGVNIQYINKLTKQVVGTANVSSANNFNHVSGTALGNTDALSPESQALVKRNAIAFPTNEEMVEGIKLDLKNKIKETIKANQAYIK